MRRGEPRLTRRLQDRAVRYMPPSAHDMQPGDVLLRGGSRAERQGREDEKQPPHWTRRAGPRISARRLVWRKNDRPVSTPREACPNRTACVLVNVSLNLDVFITGAMAPSKPGPRAFSAPILRLADRVSGFLSSLHSARPRVALISDIRSRQASGRLRPQTTLLRQLRRAAGAEESSGRRRRRVGRGLLVRSLALLACPSPAPLLPCSRAHRQR